MLATVGFGDITTKAESARLVVTVQMILDLMLLGFGRPGAITRAAGPGSRQRSNNIHSASRSGLQALAHLAVAIVR